MTPVAREGTARGCADPALFERRLRRREDVARVQRVIAAEIESCAREQVRSGSRGHGYDRVQCMPVLGVELAAKDLELLDGILPNVDRRAPPLCVVHVTAVDERRVAASLIRDAAELGDREPCHRAVDGRRAWQQLCKRRVCRSSTGSDSICRDVMDVGCDRAGSTSATSGVTRRRSATGVTDSTRSTVACAPTSSSIWRRAVLKPVRSARISYAPGRSATTR